MEKKLTELKRFEVAHLVKINTSTVMSERLTKLGFIINSQIQLISKLPFKGPLILDIQGSKVAIRYDDAEKITVLLKE